MRIVCIFGTRPEAIKMAPIVLRLRQLAASGDGVGVQVCVTAQHREMLDQVLSLFEIQPDIDLNLMAPNQSLADLTALAVKELDVVVRASHPDAVLVQGDTTTAMTGALAAFYHRVPVGHVEAGLRTGDRYSPFPEDINRRLVSALATWHFAPTKRTCEALRREGVASSTIHLTGNTGIDALLYASQRWPDSAPTFSSDGQRLLLLTAHRRENLGEPLVNICSAVQEICRRNQDVVVLYPVHLNPKVSQVVRAHLQGVPLVKLCEPLDYRRFVGAMREAYLILTDSGGIQEEAPSLGRPVLVLRNETERPEAVEAGTAKVVGTDVDRIVLETQRLLDDPEEYRRMVTAVNPFGDGRAAERIVDILIGELSRA